MGPASTRAALGCGGESPFQEESLRAALIRRLVIPLSGFKRQMQSKRRFEARIRRVRQAGDAPPPRRMRRRFQLSGRRVDGCDVYDIRPRTGAYEHVIIYLHGGAFVLNLAPLQWTLPEALVRSTGARVIVPLYPLAPEHDWVVARSMVTTLYAETIATCSPQSVTLCGDSAGGGLALALAQALREAGLPLPGRLVLFSPWLNLCADNPGQSALESRDPVLARTGLTLAARAWAGGTPLEDPRVSPVFASLRGLPPTLVFSGTADLLNADAHQLARRAAADDAPVTLYEGRNMTHLWSISPIPEAAALHELAAAFIRHGLPEPG